MKDKKLKQALGKRHQAAQVSTDDLVITPVAHVVRAALAGGPVYFTVTNPRDVIQKEHLAGRFYEPEELEIIGAHCPQGAVFADIGANIGNHSLYALTRLGVKKLIPFEPNPIAISVLTANLGLNGLLSRCELGHLGLGLSDRAAGGLAMAYDDASRNLGGGHLIEGGELQVIRGDDALANEPVDFIKIDVEGMELQVLAGLSDTIARRRPTIFIEVDETNRDGFLAWVAANRYEIAATYRRYAVNENFLLKPMKG